MTDAVGQVSNLSDVQTVQVAGNDKKKVEFRLMDIKYVNQDMYFDYTIYYIYFQFNCFTIPYYFRGESIACCLWGKYAEQLEEHLQQTNNPNMVCMIRFAKIGFYRGITNIDINNLSFYLLYIYIFTFYIINIY